jgi:hypothetical protein
MYSTSLFGGGIMRLVLTIILSCALVLVGFGVAGCQAEMVRGSATMASDLDEPSSAVETLQTDLDLELLPTTPTPEPTLMVETTTQTEGTTIGSEIKQSLGEIAKPRIIVRKSKRILELWDDQVLCASYPIGLGFEPIDHKQVEGDGRTPEGEYYVCTRNPNSRFYRALGVSYPNREDADAGLMSGTIDEQIADLIREAIDLQSCPPWNTPLGGEIMIHGQGSQSDWTAGCVAVEDEVMDLLWQHSPLGTPITILP